MIILIDGPEKAGKTTLIAELKRRTGGQVRHWGIIESDTEYLEALKSDTADSTVWLWDRGWPSEHVYSKLLNRGRRLGDDPWLGEWLYGRAIIGSGGVRVIMLPVRSGDLYVRRTSDDLPVNPMLEIAAYKEYAERFEYLTLYNDYDHKSITRNADHILEYLEDHSVSHFSFPEYCGPSNPEVIVIGDTASTGSNMSGGWLPFTSHLTTQFGRLFGPRAITCMGWTNIGGMNKILLHYYPVIACGKAAQDWVTGGTPVVLSVPHPAWLYRYNTRDTRNAAQALHSILHIMRDQNEHE